MFTDKEHLSHIATFNDVDLRYKVVAINTIRFGRKSDIPKGALLKFSEKLYRFTLQQLQILFGTWITDELTEMGVSVQVPGLYPYELARIKHKTEWSVFYNFRSKKFECLPTSELGPSSELSNGQGTSSIQQL